MAGVAEELEKKLDISENGAVVTAGDSKTSKEDDDFVDPWNVVSKSEKGIDYDKLIGTYALFCLI